MAFAQVQDFALLIFYRAAIGELELPAPLVLGEIEIQIPGATNFMATKAIEGLQEKKLITKPSVAELFRVPEITARGIEHIERRLRISNSDLAKESPHLIATARIERRKPPEDSIFEQERDFLILALEKRSDNGTAPASDRIVRLTDNQREREEAVSALDAVVHELDRANDLGGMTADEKEYLKAIVSSARNMISKANEIRVSAVTSTLVPTLNWLKSNFDQIAIGTLAGVAALAIAKLLGLA